MKTQFGVIPDGFRKLHPNEILRVNDWVQGATGVWWTTVSYGEKVKDNNSIMQEKPFLAIRKYIKPERVKPKFAIGDKVEINANANISTGVVVSKPITAKTKSKGIVKGLYLVEFPDYIHFGDGLVSKVFAFNGKLLKKIS